MTAPRPPRPEAPQAPSSSLWRVAVRRLARLLAIAAAGTAIVSLAIGLPTGSSLSRSLSFGFYLVGCGALVVGFALAVRGPLRLGKDAGGHRLVSREEREDTVADSALFVVLGVALLAIGVLTDTRYPIL